MNRSCTPDQQVEETTSSARANWKIIDEGSGVHRQLYEHWRSTPTETAIVSSAEKPVKLAWSGGCKASPISASEIVSRHSGQGWPTDSEVYQEQKYITVPNTTIDFGRYAPYNLFACSQSGKACCKTTFGLDGRCAIMHDGLCNYLETLPTSLSDTAELMLMFECKRPDGSIARWLGIITVVTRSPRCFDMACCDWEHEASGRQDELELPASCCVRARDCKVSDHYRVLAVEASGHLVLSMAKCFERAKLFSLEYEVEERDGGLMWSKIVGCKEEGTFCDPALLVPLFDAERRQQAAEKRAQNRAARLLRTDPLAKGAAKGRGRGRGPSRGRGGGRCSSEIAMASNSGLRVVSDGGAGDAGRADDLGDGEGDLAAGGPGDAVHPGVGGGGGDGDADGGPHGGDDSDFDFDVVRELEHELLGLDADDAADIVDMFAEFGGGDPRVDEEPSVVPGAQLVADAEQLVRECDGVGMPTDHVTSDDIVAISADADMPPPDVPPPPVPLPVGERPGRYRLIGPSAKGWWMNEDGDNVLQISRGVPKGSIAARCKHHDGCKFIMSIKRDPGDDALLDWFFAMEAAGPLTPLGESQRMAKEHIALAQPFRSGQLIREGASGAASSSGV